jgi:hypothetical protein
MSTGASIDSVDNAVVPNGIRVYKCYCSLEMLVAVHMQRHLDRKNPCTKDIDMSLVDVKTLITYVDKLQEKKSPRDYSGCTPEEKKKLFAERNRKASNARYLKKSFAGYMSEKQYASYVRNNMIQGTKKRNKKKEKEDEVEVEEEKKSEYKENMLEMEDWTTEDVLEILKKNQVYTIPDTHVGTIEFPLRLTNSYFNSASVDRIDDNLGYIEGNYEIRPQFLNNLYKLTTDNIKELVFLREQNWNIEELTKIAKEIAKDTKKTDSNDTMNFFGNIARAAKTAIGNKKEDRNVTFDFESNEKYKQFLIQKFIEQGGRCYYSNVPIYPQINHKYKISAERVDPRESYNKDNIVLIVVGLNTRPCGQFLNEKLTEEQRDQALADGIFNQEYWDSCTKLTEERKMKCQEARNHDRVLLESIIHGK